MHQPRAVRVGFVCALLLSAVPQAQFHAQLYAQRQPPLVGTVSPRAVGAPAPTAVPIGGLRTRPLTSLASSASPSSTGVRVGRLPLAVIDAPVDGRGVVIDTRARDVYEPSPTRAAWIPTAQRPQWTRDTSTTTVEAWRDLIVTDVVCNWAATCVERQQRIRAPWIATCRCYAFADGWNRIWRVE